MDSELPLIINEGRLRVLPESRRAEVLAFIRRGLQDFSLTRSVRRYGSWGIRVPDEPSQVIYVWIDALINYLSALGYGGASSAHQRFWSEGCLKTHVIGRNVWKFHAIYWPAILLSAGLPLPNQLLVHGFLTETDRRSASRARRHLTPPGWLNTSASMGFAMSCSPLLLRGVTPTFLSPGSKPNTQRTWPMALETWSAE